MSLLLVTLLVSSVHSACAITDQTKHPKLGVLRPLLSHLRPQPSKPIVGAALLETSSELEYGTSVEGQMYGTFIDLFQDNHINNQTDHSHGFKKHLHSITRARRHRHWPDILKQHRRTVMEYLKTAHVLYICLVGGSVVVFMWMYGHYVDWTDRQSRHFLPLLFWLVWAVAGALLVWAVRGADDAAGWTVGYLLEFIFSIENVFIFHIICQAFRAPAHLTQKAIFLVIVGQILFQAVFFMGFAHWLHDCLYLPYILGIWLIYVGFQSTRDHDGEGIDVREIPAFRFCHAILGERLSPEFPEDGSLFFVSRNGLNACTMVAPLAICLCVIDGLFEIDVTLTKIETLNHDFMCFSSSAVAACAVPELYYLGRQMFEDFHLIKYGVAWVLVFYGLQLLFHSFFELPALTGCILVMIVMALCMSCSSSDKFKTVDGETVERASIPQVTVSLLPNWTFKIPLPCLDRQSSLSDVPSLR